MIHKFSRYLLTLVALFAMTTGAWADNTVYTSGQSVRIVDLKVGDIILPGATVTRDGMSTPSNQLLKFRRCTTEWVDMSQSLPVTFDENAGLGDYHVGGKPLQPIDENGKVGNAWQVAVLTLEPFGYIATLDGITYRDPNAPVISEDGTEAEFEMPSYDATLEYDIVRNLASNMTVTVEDAEQNTRFRLKKEGESYVPAEMTPQQMAALVKVYDQTEQKYLTLNTDFIAAIYAVDEEDKATGDAIAFASLTPGRYVAIATAADGTAYDGQTAQSNVFELYEGFPVVVPATEEEGGEVDLGTVSFYTEQFNLKLETGSSAKLYTLTAIDGHTVTATEVDVVPAGMPFFVLNETDAEQMVTLLPATAEEVTPTPTPIIEFLGTDVDLTFTQEDMDGAYDYYILHRGIFVWVKDPGTLKAGKCYLRILKGQPTTARRIVFSEATGLRAIENGKLTIENEAGAVYDLSGRRVAAPTKKGVYIQNGRKVVVK